MKTGNIGDWTLETFNYRAIMQNVFITVVTNYFYRPELLVYYLRDVYSPSQLEIHLFSTPDVIKSRITGNEAILTNRGHISLLDVDVC